MGITRSNTHPALILKTTLPPDATPTIGDDAKLLCKATTLLRWTLPDESPTARLDPGGDYGIDSLPLPLRSMYGEHIWSAESQVSILHLKYWVCCTYPLSLRERARARQISETKSTETELGSDPCRFADQTIYFRGIY